MKIENRIISTPAIEKVMNKRLRNIILFNFWLEMQKTSNLQAITA